MQACPGLAGAARVQLKTAMRHVKEGWGHEGVANSCLLYVKAAWALSGQPRPTLRRPLLFLHHHSCAHWLGFYILYTWLTSLVVPAPAFLRYCLLGMYCVVFQCRCQQMREIPSFDAPDQCS